MDHQTTHHHFTRDDGWVTGGTTLGVGVTISWQDGPLPQNGATVEQVIIAARQRLEVFQASPARCEYNQRAIGYLELALLELNNRTEDRISRCVEGTYQP